MPAIQHKRWAIGICYGAMVTIAIAINLMPVFLTTLQTDLGLGGIPLTNEELGRIGAVIFAGLVAGICVTAPLADRVGAKPFPLFGSAMVALGLIWSAVSNSYAALLPAVFLMGVGAGTLDMILSPIVAAYEPEKKTAAMNWLHSFYCIGAVITVVLAAGALANHWLEWRQICLLLVPLPLAVFIGFLFLHIPTLLQDGPRMRLRFLLREPFFWAALAAIALGGATECGLAQWLPAYAETALGYSKGISNLGFIAFNVMMALGRILVGMNGQRIQPMPLMIACCVASLLLFVVGCFAPWPIVALLGCVAVGLTGSCLWPSMLGVTADRYPNGGASMFGLLSAAGNLGGISMPWLVGFAADHSTMRWGLFTSAACPLLMAVILIWMKRRSQSPR